MSTFDSPTPITAIVHVPAGRLRFVATDRTDTTVEITPATPGKSRDVKAAERTAVEFDGTALRVTTPSTHELLGPSGLVDVTVHLPAGSHVDAVGAGELHGTGRLGQVTVRSSFGPITLDQADEVHLTADAGDVTIEHLTGPAEISTTKGDIRIAEAHRGTLVLSTQLGDIAVLAAAGTSAALDATTAHGRIDNALRNDGSVQLQIRATTTQGTVTARSL